LNERLNTITRSLTSADGVPINLSLHVNAIRQSLSALDRRATTTDELLNTIDRNTTDAGNTISQTLTTHGQLIDLDGRLNTIYMNISRTLTANGQPIDLNERLNTIDTNAADTGRLLDDTRIELRAG
jgi:hypothetical protein